MQLNSEFSGMFIGFHSSSSSTNHDAGFAGVVTTTGTALMAKRMGLIHNTLLCDIFIVRNYMICLSCKAGIVRNVSGDVTGG